MQRLSIRLVAAIAAFFVGVTAASAPDFFRFNTVTRAGAEREVMEVEGQYKAAHLEGDTATLERILAEDFTLGVPSREIIRKAERLALVGDPHVSYLSFDTEDVSVEAVNEDEAVVSGRAYLKTSFYGREYPERTYKFTRKFEKRRGQWQVVKVQICCVSRR